MKKVFSKEPILINIKDVNRTIIRISFFVKRVSEWNIDGLLMTRVLSSSSKNYKTVASFNKKKEELSIMELYANKTSYNNFEVINFFMTIPKHGIIDDLSYDEAFNFLKEVIYNPNVNKEGNRFSSSAFNLEKNYLLEKEKDYPSSLREYAFNAFLDFSDDDMEVKGHHSTYLKNLKKANNNSCFNYYKENIVNNSYVTYIYGNIDNKDEIINSYNKYFKQDGDSTVVDAKYHNYISVKKYNEGVINTNYNQSVLNLCFQVKNMSKKDIPVFDMLFYFLYSRENDLVYSNLRCFNNLIYTMEMIKSDIYGLVIMMIFCTSSDTAKILEIIKNTIEQIRVKDNFEEYKERLLNALSYDILVDKDNPLSKAYNIINKDIANRKTLVEKKKEIAKVSYDDMYAFLDRFILTKKLVIVGGCND